MEQIVRLGRIFCFFIFSSLFSFNCQSPKLTNFCDPFSDQYQLFSFLITNGMFPSPNERCLPNPKKTGSTEPANSSNPTDVTSTTPELIISAQTTSGSSLAKTSSLVFQFDQIVSSDKCTVGSNFAQDSFTKAYAVGSGTTSSLTIKPSTSWTVGVLREITLDCTADNGAKNKDVFKSYYSVADSIRFVKTSGSDSNSGLSPDTAKLTISNAMSSLSSECSSSNKTCYILVAEGSYSLSSTLTLQNQISLYGSFNSDFSVRKPLTSATDRTPSILVDSRISTGGTFAVPIATVTVTGSVEKASTVFDGFTIQGPSGGTGTATNILYDSITGTGINAKNNKFEIRNPNIAYGVLCKSDSSGDFTSNLISQSGSFSGSTIQGIYLNSSVSQPFSDLNSNTITMGNCTGASCASQGIFFDSGTQNLTNNIINGGNSSQANGTSSAVRLALTAANGSMTISGNTITGGTCTGSDCLVYGVRSDVTGYSSTLTISKNTINGGTCNTGACETRGIHIVGGNATNDIVVLSNTITAGDSSQASSFPYSYGIHVDSGVSNFVRIAENTINNGVTDNSFGIAIGIRIGSAGSNSGLGITQNLVKGGSGNSVFALWGTPSSNIPITRNRFEGGTTTSSGNAVVDLVLGNNFRNNIVIGGNETSGPSTALKISGGGGSQVAGNTIVGKGSGSETIGLEFGAANTALVQANLILTESGATNRYCVKEAAVGFGPAQFTENALYDCPTAYYVDPDSAGPNKQFWCSAGGGIFSTTGGCGQPMVSPAGSANPNPVDPMFFDRTNGKYCLTASTPSTIKTGATYFGTNLDFNGNNRPGPTDYSIGAYEAGSTCN